MTETRPLEDYSVMISLVGDAWQWAVDDIGHGAESTREKAEDAALEAIKLDRQGTDTAEIISGAVLKQRIAARSLR